MQMIYNLDDYGSSVGINLGRLQTDKINTQIGTCD